MNRSFRIGKRQFSALQLFRLTLAVVGVLVVLLNDELGKIEGFVEFLFIYFILVIIAVFQWLFVNIRLLINLKSEKAKTELLNLQSQVNPHFFFNMLNNLYGLVDKDSEQAKKLILKLSDMMRYSVYEGQKERVTLQQEIDFIRNYIALHEMRYHKEIDIKFEVDVADENVRIIPLLFIILVENAFKHGVEVLRNNAFVQISLVSQNNELTFRVSNNFDLEEESESGIGLTNLRRRLELAYTHNHTFRTAIKDDVYEAKLALQL